MSKSTKPASPTAPRLRVMIADDVAETVFINLARGTGIHGLTGIKPKFGKIVRPLLLSFSLLSLVCVVLSYVENLNFE